MRYTTLLCILDLYMGKGMPEWQGRKSPKYLEARQLLAELGLVLRGMYSPVWCEVCGHNDYQRPCTHDPAQYRALPLGQSETLHMLKRGKGVELWVDNALCAGEHTMWGRGTQGGCDCSY
jgi:hypothetical protein